MFQINLDGTISLTRFGVICLIISTITPTYAVESSIDLSIYRYSSYQKGIICDAARKPFHPKTLQDVQQVVRSAITNNTTVKAIGNLYSMTDIICTDGIAVNMQAINHFRYDHITQVATVGAGLTMGKFLEQLHINGRTISGIPVYEDITIGGALGTGAHGTNLKGAASPSDQVVGLVIVDGVGKVRNISSITDINAFRAHLGLLGIIFEVSFSTIPQYKLHIRNILQYDSVLWQQPNRILRLAKSKDRFQFFWYPTSKRVVLSVGDRVPISHVGNCETHFITELPLSASAPLTAALETMQEAKDHLGYFMMEMFMKLSSLKTVPMKSPMFTKEDGRTSCLPAIGYSHKMSANRCIECPWDNDDDSIFNFEVSAIIPLAEFEDAIKTIRGILKRNPMEFPMMGIIFRFLSSSDGLMTLSSGRPSVSIEWVLVSRGKDQFTKPILGIAASQAMMQALMEKHNGRPHWGKNGLLYTQQSIIRKQFPNLPKFISRMEEYDPHGIFLNDFGRRVRFGSRKTSMDLYTKHCALVDNCICKRDEDCGDGSYGSCLCGAINNYRVCKENQDEYESFKGKVVRKFVNRLGFLLG